MTTPVESKNVCISCGSVKPKYKCTVCKKPFCSASCSKAHKASGDCKLITAPEMSEHLLAPESLGSKRRREEVVPDDADDFQGAVDDDGNIQVLGARHLAAIRGDKKLRELLRTKELRGMIKIIDKSRSRLDALEAGIHNSTEFNNFCDLLLGVIYHSN